MADNKKPEWYGVRTTIGYENKIKTDIEKIAENRKKQDEIVEVYVPTERVTKIDKRTNKKVTIERKILPGYLFVKMLMTDENWYIVRNTHGVTSYIGVRDKEGKPECIPEEEILAMKGNQPKRVEVDFKVGDTLVATCDAWRDTEGKVQSINDSKQTVTITVEVFGRPVEVELRFTDVRKK